MTMDASLMEKPDPLRGIVEFVAAAQSGSFSAAARQLDVSVAHVSRAVRDLERQTGVQLIHRTSRQSALTEAGRGYFEQCRTLLDGLAEARERLRSGQDAISGSIRVSMNGYFAETRVAPLLTAFALRHSGVRLEVEMNSRNVSLVDEGFDFVIRAGPLEPSALIAKRLVAFPVVTLAAPGLVRALGQPSRPDDLDPAQCLPLNARSWSFAQAGAVTTLRPTGGYRSNSGALLVDAAVQGAGFVQLPAYYGVKALARGDLVRVLADWTDTQQQFEFFIVYPPQRHLPARIRALIDHLVAGISAGDQALV